MTKLSISHIAWPITEEEKFLKLISKLGCSGIEIAPGKIWKEPVESSRMERRRYRSVINDHGLEIPALQALLYTRRDLGLFMSPSVERDTIEYLKRLCQLASDLGANVLVFGSPANRKRGNMPVGEAMERAVGFFSEVAPAAKDAGVCVCIEPLRPQETDFITSAADGIMLVKAVNNTGFGLHLDAKAVSEEKADLEKLFRESLNMLRHFHANDPDLTEVGSTGLVDHPGMGRALKEAGYKRYVSIEMRTQPDYEGAVIRSLGAAYDAYIKNKVTTIREKR